jgi:metal-responsive CopG/Arc/MetJ family transcriptional regulator
MSNKKHLATITILVKDRQTNSENVNKMLTENSHLIMARLGVNVQRSCVENCTGMITAAVEGTTKEINDLTEKLDGLYGIVAKASVMTE